MVTAQYVPVMSTTLVIRSYKCTRLHSCKGLCIGHQHACIYIYSFKNLQCTHGTEALSRVVHRSRLSCTNSDSSSNSYISVRFTCWNSDLIPVVKATYSRQDTSVSHSLLYVSTTKDSINCIDSRGNTSGLCVRPSSVMYIL